MMPNPALFTKSQQRFLLAVGTAVAGLGFTVMVGWHAHIATLTQIRSNWSPMQYNTALALVSCGAGLAALARGWFRWGILCALWPIVVGALTLVQYRLGVNLGIDQLLFKSDASVGALFPGRMGVTTALCLLFSGCALALIGQPRAFQWRPLLVGGLGLLTLGLASSGFFSYLTTLVSGMHWGGETPMAAHTAMGLCLIGAGLLVAAWRLSLTTLLDIEVSQHGGRTPWAILGLALLVTGWAWYTTSRNVFERGSARFEEAVHEAHSAVLNRMVTYEQILIGGRGLLTASRSVEREEWRALVQNFHIDERFPGIQGMGFASYLSHREKDRYESAIRREGFADFRIDPKGTRNEYVVTTYIEPFADRNLWAFGSDMYLEPVQRAAMDQARDSGQTVISGRVTLAQGDNQDPLKTFFLYVPVYKHGLPVQTLTERRAALLGFSYAPFLVDDLMAGVLGRGARDIRMQIFDGPTIANNALLYGDELDETAGAYHPAFKRTITSEISGRTWTFVFSTWPSFDATFYHDEPVIVLISGLVVSLLLFGITWSLTTTRARAVALADRMTTALRKTQAQFRAVTEHAHDAIVSADSRGTIVMWNTSAGHIFGYTDAEVLGKPLSILIPEHAWQAQEEALTRVASGGSSNVIGATIELTGRRKGGGEFPLELSLSSWTHDDQRFYTGILRDITERKQTQEHLDYLATHDALTGLPNRTLFADRLEQALTRSAWSKRLVAVMFLDLDRFKTINDTLGHDAGDRLLKTAATRLTATVRDGDTVARQGGDEFTIILIDMAQIDDVALVAQKILNAMVQPFDLNGDQTPITFSIGIACYPVDGIDAPTLLKRADTALYRAKKLGRNNYQLYAAA